MSENTITNFIVLFTAQKLKKFKTWQDGTMKYYSFNKKLVLTDEKGYNIDRKFYKAGTPIVGDELEFDGHIVTIESFESTEISNTPAQQLPQLPQLPQPPQRQDPPQTPQPRNQSQQIPQIRQRFKPPTMVPKKRIVETNTEVYQEDVMDLDVSFLTVPTSSTSSTNQAPTNQITQTSYYTTPQKRVRVGLSKRTPSTLHQSTHAESSRMQVDPPIGTNVAPEHNSAVARDHDNTVTRVQSSFAPASRIPVTNDAPIASPALPTPSVSSEPSSGSSTSMEASKQFKSPFADGNYVSIALQFPNSKKILGILKSKKHPKRTKVVPIKFATLNLYKETFKKIIYEHLDILLIQYAAYYYPTFDKFGKGKHGIDLERSLRSRGIGFYASCELKGDQRHESDKRMKLIVKQSRESYAKYNKDDLWVISKVPTFESSQTFLAKSTYFGPFSDGSLELDCVSPRDLRIATKFLNEKTLVYALRTFSPSTEFMMLDTLDEKLDTLPLLPYILTSAGKKKKDPQPLPVMEHIKLKREDGIDVEKKLKEAINMYHLNEDQERVLRRVAKSMIVSPGWNQEPEHPIVLVHGVYGSGKSFLAAVMIIFIQDIVDTVNEKREPEEAISFRILVSSMTNVAVDRILQTLLKLGYDHFIRIGSIKKIAKNLLPYTSKARINSNDELKELEQMLEDPQNSEQDIDYISGAIQRFRKEQGISQIQGVQVVGTTFMSSAFEVFNNVKFPLVLVDESSQLMEPLTMVPLARFSCNRLIMIGDPLQLPPTLTSQAEEGKLGKGLDKTIFDRMIEMGHESFMLRTQYRCHPRISNISNKLFYDRRLLNGVTVQDRKPLIEGLPTLLFVDVGGTEQRSVKSKSYWNDTEIAVASHVIQSLIQCGISASDLGCISLFKEQVDKLSEFLSSDTTDSSACKNVQISTVDAFQGGEKEVIILSTVRTSENQFMENQPRINVALTRAKRHLIILGNRSLFSMNGLWSEVLWECQENCMNGASAARLLSDLVATKI